MKKIAIIPNRNKDSDLSVAGRVAGLIKESGAEALILREYNLNGIDVRYVDREGLADADMLVVLGGDGTILSAAREYGDLGIPLLGINLGHLGFLAEIERTEEDTLCDILKGNYTVAEHMTLDVSVGGERFTALNDAVIHRGGFSRMLEFSLYIDDKLVNSVLADGLIISTPTGSTAYSLSAGGPIADPVLEVLIVTPICPHDLYSRSIILPVYKDIRISVRDAVKSGAYLTMDGQCGYELKANEDVSVSGGKKISLVRAYGSSFYEKLREKIFEKQDGV
ncbi:MAG: putative inorganic polyphosphate/ATP-NAD kinase [Firmicutes bacterium ADurb.Bin193]|nr:MAG: putative inorganic polyphosphate/ATP-NAD kinase [Firmicutes bacterium ADurb.Bin193]